MKVFKWSELTWEEIREYLTEGAVALLPVGSVEQHGPHLPVGTDFIVAEAVAELAAKEVIEGGVKALLLPTITYGLSSMWVAYPGTVTLRTETFLNLIKDVLKSVIKAGGEKVVVVNGHAGNSDALRVACRDAVEEVGRGEVAVLSVWELCGELINEVFQTKFFHACEVETSLMLALKRRLKHPLRPGGEIFRKYGDRWHSLDLTVRPKAYVYRPESKGMHGPGSFGRPDLASAEKGFRLLECVVTSLADFIKEFVEGKA
ncbi:MAG: creatininase family protein [Desulfurococcales archaeon]|nr:creatininase family protein [Desulfurococcales archaeon]